jgi:hypothetical protein
MRTNTLTLLLSLVLAACSASVATVAGYISTGAAVICPTLAAIPQGAQVCSAVASLVSSFLTIWAQTHPTMATALKTTSNQLVRIGSYGYFPPAVATELQKPEVAAALDSFIAAALADGGAP